MKIKDWENEKDTLHLLSQILGKYKLEANYQEPQWSHVTLNINVQGFSTGMLSYKTHTFSLEVNLLQHQIEIVVDQHINDIDLENGKTVQFYYNQIETILNQLGINLKINTLPQEVTHPIPFEKDDTHHHYEPKIAEKALDLMKFAYHAEANFINSLRVRKSKPGLFWGTFDISCIIVKDKAAPFGDDSKVIERAAFDEEMIEFGFWFGDEQFESPTCFVLPYPFADQSFNADHHFPENSYFDKQLMEFIFEHAHHHHVDTITQFFKASYLKFADFLNWTNIDYAFTPLKMKPNYLDDKS
ncbi:DUF5996 family protein [Staphylococcus sp. GDY8P120P]|uniref:DUF5996 family protein n=1 Tax=Staphylococcus sp. GDY8P120P TaxID=2804156 RepID=UPI001AEBEECB|nr:DUF5996 family protein [Staphylococcus sp. GDY8P120P]